MKVASHPRRFAMTVLFLWAVFLAPMFYGAMHPHLPVHHYTGITVLGNTKMVESVALWKEETARRFPNAVIFASHGANCGGKWICQNPVKPDSIADALYVHDLALSLRQQYPDRVIVLIICNPGHLHVNVPGVYYAKDDVWITPDKYSNGTDLFHMLTPDAVGNIFEFVEDAQ